MLNNVHTVSDLIALAKTMDDDDKLLNQISSELIEDDYDFAVKVAKRIVSDLAAALKEGAKADAEEGDADGVLFFTEQYTMLLSALKVLEGVTL
jgi:hypothetical protein